MPAMHEIEYEIHGDDMQFVEVILDPNEAVVAEAGGMMYMEDGVEMEMRDAFKESRGKRAAHEQIDAIPRQLHASQAADAAELSKARIVQVVAYCRRASTDGRLCSR